MIHYNLKIKGKVQGVSFRESAKTKANELKLFGYVKNMTDGSVFMEVEGSEDRVQYYIDWCHNGPQYAIVESVEIETAGLKGFDNFSIKN